MKSNKEVAMATAVDTTERLNASLVAMGMEMEQEDVRVLEDFFTGFCVPQWRLSWPAQTDSKEAA